MRIPRSGPGARRRGGSTTVGRADSPQRPGLAAPWAIDVPWPCGFPTATRECGAVGGRVDFHSAGPDGCGIPTGQCRGRGPGIHRLRSCGIPTGRCGAGRLRGSTTRRSGGAGSVARSTPGILHAVLTSCQFTRRPSGPARWSRGDVGSTPRMCLGRVHGMDR